MSHLSKKPEESPDRSAVSGCAGDFRSRLCNNDLFVSKVTIILMCHDTFTPDLHWAIDIKPVHCGRHGLYQLDRAGVDFVAILLQTEILSTNEIFMSNIDKTINLQIQSPLSSFLTDLILIWHIVEDPSNKMLDPTLPADLHCVDPVVRGPHLAPLGRYQVHES